MNDRNEHEESKINRSRLKKILNEDLKDLKHSSEQLRTKKLEQAAELERLKEVVSSLQQEKDKIIKTFEFSIQTASLEIKLQEIGTKIEQAQKDVKDYETSINGGRPTRQSQQKFDETKQQTFDDFKDYMISSPQFEALVKKAESMSLKGVSAMDDVSTNKYLILKDRIDALKEAKDFPAWKEAIDDMKSALKNPDLSERRTEGLSFFDRLTERSTKNLMKDFLDYNESKHDDLWYRSGAQAGPSKW